MKIKINKLILLVNLGSPQRFEVKAIRAFLREFLSDQRVVGLPRWLWFPILYGIILPIRAKKLLHKYAQIWHSSGVSPLVFYTQRQVDLLTKYAKSDDIVDYAFCYGNNSITNKLTQLEKKYTFSKLIIIPLYPQYSSSTSASVFDQISNFYIKRYYIPHIEYINSFASNELYIKALANSVQAHWQKHGKGDKLLLSFHSIPVKLVNNGDTYVDECMQTKDMLSKELGLTDNEIMVSFQSKFGKAEWVTPATDVVIKELATITQNIDVICPGFVSDCLETLEEVAISYRELYKINGGNELRYIDCLNDNEDLVKILAQLANLNGV